MSRRTRVRVAAFLLAAALSHASAQQTARVYFEPATEPPEHQVDMLHMRLAVSFLPELGVVRGVVTHRFTPLRQRVDSLFLNGPGIRVSTATCDGKPVPFTTTSEGITLRFAPPLHWGRTDSVTLTYEAAPRRGIYFVGWNDSTRRSRRQIWTQGQGIDNRHWIPCYDEQNDKFTTEIFVRVPPDLRVLSNGTRLETLNDRDGSAVWHYRMEHPHASYLVMLGIGDYRVEHRTSKSGVPVELWYYPETPDRVEPTYRHTTEMVDFMEAETGVPYPWESYAQIPVQDFLYGGMENTTATVFGDFYLVDMRGELDNSYLSVNIHELAHQWFGDYVTGRSGVSSWLHESFATFYAKLFLRTVAGEDEVQWTRRKEQDAAIAASRTNRFPILHSQAGRDRVYAKGSAVLDLAQHIWGEDSFRRVITYYLRKHPYGSVETRDLYTAFQDVLGVSPWWFFDEWILRGGEPHYRIATHDSALAGSSGRATMITVEQIHEQDDLVGTFTVPIWFQVHYSDGTSDSLCQKISAPSERVIIPNPHGKEVDFVLFDPGSYVPKQVMFPRSYETLRAQALHAPLMIDRYDAIAALREIPMEQKRSLLAERFSCESHYAIRAEIATQLSADSQSLPTIRAALGDRSVRVRRATLDALPMIPASLGADVESLLRDSSYLVTAKALRMVTTQFPERRAAALDATRGVAGVGNQIRVLRHEIRAEGGDQPSLDSLIDLAGTGFEFRTRVNALEALRRIDRCPPALIPALCNAVTHPNPRLRDPASEVLRHFISKNSVRSGVEAYVRSRTWATWQAELLEGFLR